MTGDSETIFMQSDVLEEPVEIEVSNPFMVHFLRIELHKKELEVLQERMECGEYDSWPEDKRGAKTAIRELQKEIKRLEGE